MLPQMLALQAVMDYAKRQRQAKEMKREAAGDLRAQAARSLGAPTYGYEAAKVQRKADQMTKPDNLGMFQSYVSNQSAADQADATAAAKGQPVDEEDDDRMDPLMQTLYSPKYRS